MTEQAVWITEKVFGLSPKQPVSDTTLTSNQLLIVSHRILITKFPSLMLNGGCESLGSI